MRVESSNGEPVVDLLGSTPRFYSSSLSNSQKPSKIISKEGFKGMGKSSSQTNLTALGGQGRTNELRRSKLFNTVGRELVNATPEPQNFPIDNLNDRVEINQDERKISSHNSYNPTIFNNGSFNVPNSPGFDNYYANYQKRKETEHNKNPSEHRSKYFNDVFASTVNMGIETQSK